MPADRVLLAKNGSMRPSFPTTAILTLVILALQSATLASSPRTQRRIRFNEGIIYFTDQDYVNAEVVFAELVAADAEDVSARYWLGLCQLQGNEYEAASSSFAEVLQMAPDQVQVKLDSAIAMIGLDQFDTARPALVEFLASGAGDAHMRRLAHFFLGVTEYKRRDFDAALAAFDAAAEGLDTGGMRANIEWYRGWIFVEQRRLEEAVTAFEQVTDLATNADQQARAGLMAEQVGTGTVDVVELVNRLEFRFDLGFSYDSNVVLLGDDTSLEIGLSTDDDFRFGLHTDVRYVQPLGPNWLLGLGASTFTSWHGSLQEFNVQTYGGRMFLNYFPSDDLSLGLEYEYEYSLVNNTAFLGRHQLTPSIRLVEDRHEDGTPHMATTVFYSYEPRDYHDDIFTFDERRDGDYHTVGVTQSFNTLRPNWIDVEDERLLSGSIGYRWHNDSTVGDDFDMSANVLALRVDVPLPDDWDFRFNGEWAWENYWQPNSQDFRRRNREDFVQRYTWSLRREFEIDSHISMAVRGNISWTDDDSNVRNPLREAIYSYDRVVYGLTLSFYFQ